MWTTLSDNEKDEQILRIKQHILHNPAKQLQKQLGGIECNEEQIKKNFVIDEKSISGSRLPEFGDGPSFTRNGMHDKRKTREFIRRNIRPILEGKKKTFERKERNLKKRIHEVGSVEEYLRIKNKNEEKKYDDFGMWQPQWKHNNRPKATVHRFPIAPKATGADGTGTYINRKRNTFKPGHITNLQHSWDSSRKNAQYRNRMIQKKGQPEFFQNPVVKNTRGTRVGEKFL